MLTANMLRPRWRVPGRLIRERISLAGLPPLSPPLLLMLLLLLLLPCAPASLPAPRMAADLSLAASRWCWCCCCDLNTPSETARATAGAPLGETGGERDEDAWGAGLSRALP